MGPRLRHHAAVAGKGPGRRRAWAVGTSQSGHAWTAGYPADAVPLDRASLHVFVEANAKSAAGRFPGRTQPDARRLISGRHVAKRRRVASPGPLLYESGMHSRSQTMKSRSAALAAET